MEVFAAGFADGAVRVLGFCSFCEGTFGTALFRGGFPVHLANYLVLQFSQSAIDYTVEF